MKIKTLLIFSSVVLIGFSITVAGIVLLTTRQTQRITAQANQAEALMTQVFELNSLTLDYLRSYAERPKVQWGAQYALLDQTLSGPLLQQLPSRDFVAPMRADLQGMKTSFDQIVVYATDAGTDPLLTQQFSSDFLVKTRRMISQADRLSDAAVEAMAQARARNDWLIFTVLALFAMTSISLLMVLYRRITVPIARLQLGAEIVGKGDLHYQVRSEARDEIGQLSRAFDRMTGQLKASYETLEEKVKERTSELQELTRKNETMLKCIGDGVLAIDTDWNIILCNDAAEQLSGWTRREVIGKPLRSVIKFIRESDRSENILFISDAMLSGKVRFMQNHTVLVRKDGSEIPVGDSAAPIIDAAGKITGAIIVFRDTTSERDAHLIRSSFAYASHQMRTPVTEALWSIELARDESKSAAAKKQMDVALNSMKSVRKLVNGMMEVSEIDQKTVVPIAKKVKMKTVLNEVSKLVADRATLQKVAVSIGKLPPATEVTTDARLLVRALYEVVDNAIFYSKPASEVSLSGSVISGRLVVEVRDKGIGIPAEQESLIFTKFFRGSNIPQGSVGAGLGLYVSREYLKLLDGKIWFKTEEGKGTTFFLSLPLT